MFEISRFMSFQMEVWELQLNIIVSSYFLVPVGCRRGSGPPAQQSLGTLKITNGKSIVRKSVKTK